MANHMECVCTARNITIDFAFRISHFILWTLCVLRYTLLCRSSVCVRSFLCISMHARASACFFCFSRFICSSCSIAIISHTKRIKKEEKSIWFGRHCSKVNGKCRGRVWVCNVSYIEMRVYLCGKAKCGTFYDYDSKHCMLPRTVNEHKTKGSTRDVY